MTGKRHGFHAQWRVGFDDDGRSTALDATLTSDGGWSLDLSEPVLARALCHVDNAYWIPNVRVQRPDRPDPQDLADGLPRLRRPAGDARHRGHPRPLRAAARDRPDRPAPPQLLRRGPEHALRPAGAPRRSGSVRAWEQVLDAERRRARGRAEVAAFNAAHEHTKRGLAMTPVKFGISFNFTAVQPGRRARARLQGRLGAHQPRRHRDGPGPAHEDAPGRGHGASGCRCRRVRLAPTRTDKVPNTSATAASSGADLNGGAVKNACEQIRRCAGGRATRSRVRLRSRRRDLRRGRSRRGPTQTAYFQRVQLWAAGFYRTEGLHWDSTTMQGSPFKYFAYGVAATEVEVDGFTGAYRTRRVDIVHDVGDSLSPARRHRPGRGRLRAGRRLADPGGPALGRERRTRAAAGSRPRPRAPTSCPASPRCPRSSTSPCSSTPTRTAPSTAPRRSASRRSCSPSRCARRCGRRRRRSARRRPASTSPPRPRPRPCTGRSSRPGGAPSPAARRRGRTRRVPDQPGTEPPAAPALRATGPCAVAGGPT